MNERAAGGTGPSFRLVTVLAIVAVGAAVEEGRNLLATALTAHMRCVFIKTEFDHDRRVAVEPSAIDGAPLQFARPDLHPAGVRALEEPIDPRE